jgi:hypothetical protein
MKSELEQQLRDLWKSVRSKHAPYPQLAEDIEEFLNAAEWDIALEHILDWAAAEKKLPQAEARAAQLRAEMKRLSGEKPD